MFQRVKGRLDHRVTEILTRLRSSRLICSDETSARVNGQQQGTGRFKTPRSVSMSSAPAGARA